MGENVWRDEHEWPLARTQWTSCTTCTAPTVMRSLSTEPPADEPPDSFVYDPTDPAPGSMAIGPTYDDPVDLDAVAARPDVLVYTTEPLADDMEITGPVTLELWASSSAPSTDFTAKLIEVFPDGSTIRLCQGIVRTSVGVTPRSGARRGVPLRDRPGRDERRRSRPATACGSTCRRASSRPTS